MVGKRVVIAVVVMLLCACGIVFAQDQPVVVNTEVWQDGKFTVEYPQISGNVRPEVAAAINEQIREIVTRFISAYRDDPYTTTAQLKYAVHYSSLDTWSISLSTYVYSGGAHGTSTLRGYTFDLISGSQYELRDIIHLDEAGTAAVNTMIAEQIQARNIPIFTPFRGVGDKPNFYLAEDGRVIIVFEQYEIAPYSSGILRFPLQTGLLNQAR